MRATRRQPVSRGAPVRGPPPRRVHNDPRRTAPGTGNCQRRSDARAHSRWFLARARAVGRQFPDGHATAMKVGFIGLGTMGASMASNLQRGGYDLVVNDIRPDAGAAHLAAGAEWADTARDVASKVDVVFTSLPGPPEVENVALGENGLLAGLQAGTAYFALSTNWPTLIRHLHAL